MASFSVGESSSSSPSISSSAPRLCTYHVFLSFRGEDTRKGFTGHLYAALERKGITTFRDDKDLERGQVISQELLKAIEESMFAITILSPDYASSAWCLDELQKIMECNSNLDLEVLPVFYGVDPSDVRHQKGSYEEAFRKHQEKFGQHSDRVERWRDALTQVASYSGWDSKDQHEAVLVESIAQHIHNKLVPKLPSCTKNLVGIASKVEEVTKVIGMGLNDVRFKGRGCDDNSTNLSRFNNNWHHSSRIIRVSRASGGKDRHSKVFSSKGLRDRRVRLSVTTAIQFYDLQDRLGYDQPSKAVEWLIKSASAAISELPSLNNTFPDTPKQPSDEKTARVGGNQTDSCGGA